MQPTSSADQFAPTVNPLSGIGTASSSPLSPFFATLDVKHILAIAFGLIFFVWLVYTLVVLYHWMRYGHRSALAIPSFLTHIVVSGALLIMALSAF